MILSQLARARAPVVRALAAAGCLLLAAPSLAETSAREHFEQGVAASRRGDLVVALEHFEQAQALAPNQTVLYNLGQTYSALARPVEALRALEGYLAMDGPSGDAARRREVQALIQKNEARVGRLDVGLDPPEAILEIDGAAASATADGSIRVAAGRRLLTATHEGYRAAVLPVEVRAGETTKVTLELEPVSAAPAPAVEPRCPPPVVLRDSAAERRLAENERTRRIVAYSSGGLGIVLGGVAAVFYFTNQSRYDDWRRDQAALARELAAGQSSSDQARRAESLQERAATIQRVDDLAVGTGVLGGVLVALSAVLLLTEDDGSEEPAKRVGNAPLRIAF